MITVKLRNLIKGKGLTTKEASKLIGVSENTLYRWFGGKSEILLKSLDKICAGLQCTINDIIEYVDDGTNLVKAIVPIPKTVKPRPEPKVKLAKRMISSKPKQKNDPKRTPPDPRYKSYFSNPIDKNKRTLLNPGNSISSRIIDKEILYL